jgi:leader peptidase (prepilin peptidase)/N-methyltransferase
MNSTAESPPESKLEAAEDRTPGIGELSGEYRTIATGAAIALSVGALVTFGLDARAAISIVFVVALSFLAALDLQFSVIPNRIVLPAAGIVLVAQLIFFNDKSLEWIAAAIGASLVFLLPAALRSGSVGMGDVKLAFLIGAGLGREVIPALLYGSLIAAAVAISILIRRGSAARAESMPIGAYLAAGAIIALLTGSSL